MELSVTAIVNELKSKVKNRIKYGNTKQEIIRSMVGLYGDKLGDDAVAKEVEEIIDSFPNFDFIQQIMRSKIVQEIDGRTTYILDPVSRTVESTTKERLLETLHPKLDISDRIYTCKFTYDPYTLKQLYKSKNGIWYYNTYVPPFWQEETFYSGGAIPIKKEENIPKIYHRFLNHLFDEDKESYEYTLDWMANAIKRRNYCILTTIGIQGAGKGTLGDILKELVGESNFTATGNRILAGQFNSQIENKRIVYCDEASVKEQKEEERLKVLVNGALEIEAKGKDAKYVKNYASFYFSSNYMDSIKIEDEDRRFSIVQITNKKLPTAFTVAEMDSLLDKNNIEKLARFLYHREVDENKMLKVFVSKRTEEVRSEGLPGWADWLLDEYAIDNAGKTIKVHVVSEAIVDIYGSKYRFSRAAFKKLERVYPSKIKVVRPTIDGKRVWCIEFPHINKD